MYMLRPGANLNTVPDIGGPLTQWHIHDNLCFTGGRPPPCRRTDRLERQLPPAAGEGGIGSDDPRVDRVATLRSLRRTERCRGRSVKPGETRNCDHVHGAASNGL